MNWLYSLSQTELIFIGLFVLLYGLYIWRTFWLANQLGTSAWGVVPKFFLRSSYLSLLLIALLGPSFGEAEGEVAAISRDVFIVIDVSRSMDANDVVPTRLERVKFDVQQLCDSLPADRFGIILAADEPLLLSPLTNDHDALRQVIRDIRTNVLPGGGALICNALELAQQKLLTTPSIRRNAQAILLFSDGETNETCAQSTLNQLRRNSLSLITVGVGTEGGASIRAGRDFVRDADRQIVRSRLNRTFLQNLVRNGQGQYLEADVNEHFADQLITAVLSLKGSVADQRRAAVLSNKYYYFLLAALLLISLDIIIRLRTFRL
ncbi:vWA domain-containing protein [Spirosoma montaniterrae]|uniref:VWFA domain-containing protein n=1 Tax=Spirosoma montaniterrae TaxID=1178516 RepID=A0A1P9WTB9_9BACT|nr:VWA domain-containing protein [Spirosoma montaniterrae]AQG78619.1 hypothetical protein AWR27_04250 [Spirosoma montaniterrae]